MLHSKGGLESNRASSSWERFRLPHEERPDPGDQNGSKQGQYSDKQDGATEA